MSGDVAAALSADEIARRLRTLADPARASVLQGFFKTGAGEYAEGDVFIGVRVPQLRALGRACRGTPPKAAAGLLQSAIHEERLLGLMLLVDAFSRGTERERREIYELYLASTARINNWDLVDLSAPMIVGGWLADRNKGPLTRLARSTSLWERRIAIVSTLYFIRRGAVDETFRIADLLLKDRHDLIHKASGWMLREAGKQDAAALRRYLAARHGEMPRTMLRYAIERFPEPERQRFLAGDVQPVSRSTRSAGRSTTKASPYPSGKRKPKP